MFKEIYNKHIVNLLKKEYVVKLIPQRSKKLFSYKVTNLHIGLIFLIMAVFVFSFYLSANIKVIDNQRKISKLRHYNKKQQEKIKELHLEKQKIAALLIKQNEVLTKEIIEVKNTDNEIRKLVGLKPKEVQKNLKSYRGRVSYSALENKVKNLKESIDEAQEEIKTLKNPSVSYRKKIERRKILARLDRIPSRWPVSGYISSYFGWRRHPIYGGSHFHTGLDIIAGYGSNIYATASGEVVSAGYMGGYGYTVKIDHHNGWVTMYAHCSSILVSQGTGVKKGQAIALVGESGTATGPHLHYEVYKGGTRIDPYMCLNTENRYFANIAAGLKKL